jgi:hypothetical protein
MKTAFKALLSLCLLVPLVSSAQNFNTKTVIPKSLSDYPFGMRLGDFTKKNSSATTRASNTPGRIEYLDNVASKEIKQVIYYFDDDNDQPLYEMIIQFNSARDLDNHCSNKLGSPNEGKQWKWKTKEGHIFKAWRFGTTLVLALALPSTEWENGWDN